MARLLTITINQHKSPTLLQVAKSVLAAFFGVQSEANRERDFTQGKPSQFILVGFLLTLVFVLLLLGIVKLVLTSVGI
jgi:hypothetical protein